MHFGNCGEMSAVAYLHLRPLIRPITLVEVKFFSSWRDANHAFVVIGRDAASVNTDIRKWNPECAVCDPWANKAYPLRQIEAEMTECDFSRGVKQKREDR